MRHGHSGAGVLGLGLALLLLAGAPAAAQDEEPAAAADERPAEVRADSMVQCLLPAEIDRLGSQLTKLGPRRTIETSAEDCAERQGEVVEQAR